MLSALLALFLTLLGLEHFLLLLLLLLQLLSILASLYDLLVPELHVEKELIGFSLLALSSLFIIISCLIILNESTHGGSEMCHKRVGYFSARS